MFIVLLTLFAIAVVLIVAGLVLSPRERQPDPARSIRYTPPRPAQRNGYRVQYHAIERRGGAARHASMRRSTVEVERQVFANLLSSMNVGRLFGRPRAGEPTPWLGVALILIALVCFTMISLRNVLPGSAMLLGMTPDEVAATPTAATTLKAQSQPLFPSSGASKNLIRISQLDPRQYNSTQDFDTWAYSACSAASMTVVLNAYESNHQRYRIADILKVEAGLNQITPDQGLKSVMGIDRTVEKFGYKAVHLNNPSLDEVINIAHNGNPVIVNFPPNLWTGGHLLVLRGGDSQSVYLADSSNLNWQVKDRKIFLKYWAGVSIVVMPAK